jgi:N-sulfoglucosamine sulfohydrolase
LKSRYIFTTGIAITGLAATAFSLTLPSSGRQRPNILFCMADDQSFPHAGAYGCKWVKTPAFDRVASEGILFTNAYTCNAKCAPSRSSILTGRNSWQLEEAANHVPFFPAKFKTYAESLMDEGYHVGYTAKGWAPGDPGFVSGKRRELLGPAWSSIKTTPPARFISNVDYAANFEAFLKDNPEGKPFCFWFGSNEPHRPYEFKAGTFSGGKSTSEIDRVPGFWPDNDTVRNDLLDYAFEIEYFDSQVSKMLGILEDKGLLQNTIVIITADNGMPFPRVKGNAYEMSNHLPLAIMWRQGIRNPGSIIDDFISFTDFAPTFLEAAGIQSDKSGMQPMEGKSLFPLFEGMGIGKFRDFMVVGKERTDLGRPDDQGYPIRGIVTCEFLYLRNYHSERWPAGNPETGYMDCDGSPTKSFILNDRQLNGKSRHWEMNFGKLPDEQLYRISTDRECMENLAGNPEYLAIKNKLVRQMTKKLKKDGDPRMFGKGDIFDTYPYSEDIRNFYNRFMAGEKLKAGWINESDIEKEITEQ